MLSSLVVAACALGAPAENRNALTAPQPSANLVVTVLTFNGSPAANVSVSVNSPRGFVRPPYLMPYRSPAVRGWQQTVRTDKRGRAVLRGLIANQITAVSAARSGVSVSGPRFGRPLRVIRTYLRGTGKSMLKPGTNAMTIKLTITRIRMQTMPVPRPIPPYRTRKAFPVDPYLTRLAKQKARQRNQTPAPNPMAK